MSSHEGCKSVYCELNSLEDHEEVIIEFANAQGHTIQQHKVSPRLAEELMYEWCMQNLE